MVLYFIPLRKFGIATEKVQLANLQEVHALNSMLKQGKSVLITRVDAQTQLSFVKDSSLDKKLLDSRNKIGRLLAWSLDWRKVARKSCPCFDAYEEYCNI